MEMSEKRVLIIGLDGATFDLIEPWAAEGYLPNLARLLANARYGRLTSTIQPTTAPAWATFMTGVNQGKHGLYDFVRRQPNSYSLEVTSASQIVAPTIFQIASQRGRRVIAVNVPYTYPPHAVNGIIVGGPFVPTVSPELVWPPTYYDVLQKIAPDYFILPDFDARAKDPMTDYAHKLLKACELRERVSLHFLQTVPWDLFAVVFMATDLVQHTYWHCMEAPEHSPAARYRYTIRQVYQRIDQAIGAMLDQIAANGDGRETAVLILSDHGAGPFRLMINLNGWLAEAGYLQFRATNSTSVLRQLKVETMKNLAKIYRRYLPAATRAEIRSKLGAQRFAQMKGGFESALLTSNVAWAQTRAYALGAGGNIYINVKGREPSGLISPGGEYEALRQELSQALMTMADPESGAPLIERVYRREELYHGQESNQAPDLIIQWKDYADWGRGQYDSRSPVFEVQQHFDFSDQPLTGSHRLEGILLAQGPGIQAGPIEKVHMLDMAPTILSLLDIAPPTEMDGRILTEIVPSDQLERLSQADSKTTTHAGEFAYSSEEVEIITRHLRSLGYL